MDISGDWEDFITLERQSKNTQHCLQFNYPETYWFKGGSRVHYTDVVIESLRMMLGY